MLLYLDAFLDLSTFVFYIKWHERLPNINPLRSAPTVQLRFKNPKYSSAISVKVSSIPREALASSCNAALDPVMPNITFNLKAASD